MNAQKQLEEYRRRQAQRFKHIEDDEEDEEQQQQIEEFEQIAKRMDEEEKKRFETLDLEIAQKLERELNFRASSGFNDIENSPQERLFEEDVGDEGHPAQVPLANNVPYLGRNRNNGNNGQRQTYVKQDPPKWLLHPIALDKTNVIKVYNFKRGTVNDELRQTTDSSVNYEYENVEEPALKGVNIHDLEDKLSKKQEKRIKKFNKEEQTRIDEARRSGSIIEERNHSVESDEAHNENGVNEPLLNRQANAANLPQNNAGNRRGRVVFPGIVRQVDGTYRVC